MIYDYDDLNAVIKLQRDNEGYVRDMRRQSKEAIDFVTKRDGQWEPSIIQKFKGRPRYTDDRVNPIINQMVGELFQAEFTGRVRPAGGGATQETAKALDGLVRTIRNKSHFNRIINQTGRRVAICGIGGWEIVKDYASPDSFDMDLMIQPIEDFHERVLIDPNSMSPVGEDAQWSIVKHYIGKKAFSEKFGEDKKVCSLGHDDWSDSYYYKPDNVTVGQIYYLKPRKKEMVLMSNGAVYEANDDLDKVIDELEMAGITEVSRREADDFVCVQRWYSADEWLTDEEVLDFNFIPVIPVYGNFEVTEGKVIYFGAVERLMDIQRVHNYAFTRNVEEVALSPRSKWFMTAEQVAGYEAKIRTLNTNMDPVQLYNHVPDQPPPFYSDTSSASQSLSNLIALTDDGIAKASGIFAANIGDNPNVQSGVAIQEQIDRGNNGTAWLFECLEQSIEYTCKLLLRAIPKTYDGTREVVLTQDDGSLQTKMINEPVVDQQTQETIYLYDVTQGQYDVTIDIGAGYKNRQQEAVEAFERLAQIDPALMELGRDIHLNNLEAPNMDLVAQRARQMMLNQGAIPEDQMTEEELQIMQQQQAAQQGQPAPPDPQMIALEIEQMKAQTAMMDQQNRQQDSQLQAQKLQVDAQLKQMELEEKRRMTEIKIAELEAKLSAEQRKSEIEGMTQAGKLDIEQQKLDQSMMKMMNEMALKMADMEARYAQDMNAAVADNKNVLRFDPATGTIG